ncbi:MAG TPA: metallophosphoesterase [Spirochaetota bacterium]|nr:metallophosphoesterase [Spirochaetota bacterium]
MDRPRTTRARYAGPRAAFRVVCLALALVFAGACARPVVEREADDITFALTGNTLPESPYGKMSPRVADAFARINNDNPVFTVHLGNIVYGGKQWMGIKESDVARQYREFVAACRALRSIVYTVKGDMDTYNDTADLYRKHLRRAPYYSFNYGNVHFIVLDTTDPIPGAISPGQRSWLEADLERYRHAPAIFVFSHHSMLPPKHEASTPVQGAAEILSLFAKYPVKAVFSGQPALAHTARSGDILCITAGSGGFNREDQFRKKNQYYMVYFIAGSVRISKRQAN